MRKSDACILQSALEIMENIVLHRRVSYIHFSGVWHGTVLYILNMKYSWNIFCGLSLRGINPIIRVCPNAWQALINTANLDYFASKFEQCMGNSRRLYCLMNGLLQRWKSTCLPQNDDIQELATRFANFFSAKIETIRVTVDNNSAVTPSLDAGEQQSASVPQMHPFMTSLISISTNSSPSHQQHLRR